MKQKLTQADNDNQKYSQQGNGRGTSWVTSSRDASRAELCGKRERNSFAGRRTSLCKSLEVGRSGKVERLPGSGGEGG